MKRTLQFATLAAVLALPMVVNAQDTPKTMQFGVSGGLTLPMGDVGDLYNSGFNVTGHIYLRPASLASLAFRGDVGMDRFKAKGENSIGSFSSEGTYTSINVVANAIYSFPQGEPASMFRPYVLGGLGLFNQKSSFTLTTVTTTENETSVTKPGVQVGAGADIALAGFTAFVEARFVNAFNEGSSGRWVPIVFGLRF